MFPYFVIFLEERVQDRIEDRVDVRVENMVFIKELKGANSSRNTNSSREANPSFSFVMLLIFDLVNLSF